MEYDAYKGKLARPKEYGKTANRFLDAAFVYERYFNEFVEQQRKKPRQGDVNNNLMAFNG